MCSKTYSIIHAQCTLSQYERSKHLCPQTASGMSHLSSHCNTMKLCCTERKRYDLDVSALKAACDRILNCAYNYTPLYPTATFLMESQQLEVTVNEATFEIVQLVFIKRADPIQAAWARQIR